MKKLNWSHKNDVKNPALQWTRLKPSEDRKHDLSGTTNEASNKTDARQQQQQQHVHRLFVSGDLLYTKSKRENGGWCDWVQFIITFINHRVAEVRGICILGTRRVMIDSFGI